MLTEFDIAYCAGLFDGEGTIFLGKGSKSTRKPRLQVQMTDRAPVAKIASVFGGSVYAKTAQPGKKPLFSWTVEGKRAMDAAVEMLPYFVIKRRRALAEMVASYPLLPVGVRLSKIASAERNQKIEAMFSAMQTRNKKRERPALTRRVAVEPSAVDYAYLAGIFDGEGTLRSTNNTKLYGGSCSAVWSSDPELIRWLWVRWGGRVYTHQPKNKKHKTCWSWRCSVTAFRKWAAHSLQYMQIERKIELAGHWQKHTIMRETPANKTAVKEIPSRWGALFE